MARRRIPALIAHGGAGGRSPVADHPARRRAILSAVQEGARLLREGANALEAVVATVKLLEDSPLFNAGYGSVLTTDGKVEMDAGVVSAERMAPAANALGDFAGGMRLRAGGVVMISRVRNPVELARFVMEHTPHLLIGGEGAERLARQAGMRLLRPGALVSERSRERWQALMEGRAIGTNNDSDRHGTVGAVAIDSHGSLAAATSTGGMSGKLPGRIGDSAIVGAGLMADANGASSATGAGEAILRYGLCREVVTLLGKSTAMRVADRVIEEFDEVTGAQAGVIVVDGHGRFGYAHSAEAMEIAMFDNVGGLQHLVVENYRRVRSRGGSRSN